jgi:hypothetical protein
MIVPTIAVKNHSPTVRVRRPRRHSGKFRARRLRYRNRNELLRTPRILSPAPNTRMPAPDPVQAARLRSCSAATRLRLQKLRREEFSLFCRQALPGREVENGRGRCNGNAIDANVSDETLTQLIRLPLAQTAFPARVGIMYIRRVRDKCESCETRNCRPVWWK